MGTNARKTSKLTTLKRRRDFLAKILAETDEPLSWDKAEKSALDWAIAELEKANGTAKTVSAQGN